MPIPEQALHAICDRATLFAFLRESLGWPVAPEAGFLVIESQGQGEGALRAEVRRIVPVTAGAPFPILLVEFQTPFQRSDLRDILRQLNTAWRRRDGQKGEAFKERAQKGESQSVAQERESQYVAREDEAREDVLFVCVTQDYRGIRFARFEQQANRPPKLRVFGWERGQPVQALLDGSLSLLKAPPRNPQGAFDWSRARWDDAWDVEKLTRAFFRAYRRTCEAVERRIAAENPTRSQEWRDVAQRLCLRLLLQQFLSGREAPRFADTADDPMLLRSQSANTQDALHVPDDIFERVVPDLFARWNFTLRENAPLDVEVALDPEALGKAFEKSAPGRRETGAYYTPRHIVAFMCREALKHYLISSFEKRYARERGDGDSAESERWKAAIAAFVEDRSVAGFQETEREMARVALQRVRVADPACGAGAYLLGMLQELAALRKLLARPNGNDEPRSDSKRCDDEPHDDGKRCDDDEPHDDYERTREIIRRNLYGRDLDAFAVHIARLRLWLAMAAEREAGETPEPLDALETNIRQGDSLITPDAADGSLPKETTHESAVRIAETTFDSPPSETPDELWTSEGFDIVVTNPPYIRHALLKERKPALQRAYPALYAGTADLYCYFYARTVQLLRPDGVLAILSSNKWLRAAYGANLRRYMAERCRIESVTDFGDLPVFPGAVAYPMIFIARKCQDDSSPVFTQVKSLQPPYPDVQALVRQNGRTLAPDAIRGARWNLTDAVSADRLRKMEKMGIPLAEVLDGRIYRGVTTGLNAAFVLDGATRARLIAEDPRSAQLIKPFARGEDIRRWRVAPGDAWLLFTRRGVDIDAYPAVKAYLAQWREELTPKRADTETRGRKPGGYQWYEVQDETAYFAVFEQVKIVSTKLSLRPTFALDETGRYFGNTAYILPARTDARFLLGVLNSEAFEMYARQVFVEKRRGWYETQPKGLAAFPIPNASPEERQAIADLTQKRLDAQDIEGEKWEREINERVAALYGL